MAPELRESDLVAVREQLGREPTVDFSVVCRCAGGHPLVIWNAPLDADGAPFPTTYWLTCPDAVKAVSRIESTGAIAELNALVDSDPDFADQLRATHRSYAADRARDLPEALDWGGVGGTSKGVKCLHAHYAYHLAGGADPVGAWTAERVEPVHPGSRGGRVAAIDQGTNSTRLLVLEPGGDPPAPPTELARDMIITRLGEGVDATGSLVPVAIARTSDVLARFARRARALGAERIRVGATSAVRDAANREEFAGAVREATGADMELIDGEKEAALSFLGGTRGLAEMDGPFLVLDIGGGSTEFVFGRSPGLADRSISTQMGSVRMTERYLGSDPPAEGELEAMDEAIELILDEAADALPLSGARTFVAVGGTATTLRAIDLGLPRYDPDRIHRTWLSLDAASRITSELAGMTVAERNAIPVMAPGRGPVIVAGASILLAVMRRSGFERVLASETDILDGLAFELLDVG